MCDRCPELEERIAWLESELGLIDHTSHIAAIRKALNASPSEAEIIFAMHSVKGRFVTKAWLDERVAPRMCEERATLNSIVVWVSRLRARLGRDFIESSWGQGYRLSDRGQRLVADVLAAQPRAAAA